MFLNAGAPQQPLVIQTAPIQAQAISVLPTSQGAAGAPVQVQGQQPQQAQGQQQQQSVQLQQGQQVYISQE